MCLTLTHAERPVALISLSRVHRLAVMPAVRSWETGDGRHLSWVPV